MGRTDAGNRRRLACFLTGAGSTGAAAAAHHAAGGGLPTPLSVAGLTVLVALAFAAAPRKLRTVRAQLLAGALLQPGLHVLFDGWPSRMARPDRYLGAGLAGMLIAHLAAALLVVWLARNADRLVGASRVVRELLGRLVASVVLPDMRLSRCVSLPPRHPSIGRFVGATGRRRGPPHSAPLPVPS